MVSLAGDVIRRYERFSLYNSPYPAHDAGCAIDLYPGGGVAASPVGGEVLRTRRVRCPEQPYAASEDFLVLVGCGEYVARILHVDPAVEAGETVAVGDTLGSLVRSGFFGRWVDDHIHLGFRRRGQNYERARGSVPIEPDVEVDGVPWDGTGTVVASGPTHVRLDSPSRDGEGFEALGSDEGRPLDGGLPHYADGGVHEAAEGTVSLLGAPVGEIDGRGVRWRDVGVFVDGERATGLSLFASRGPIGAKIVFEDGHGFERGDAVEVEIDPGAESVRLG
jgi:hypothetical protein